MSVVVNTVTNVVGDIVDTIAKGISDVLNAVKSVVTYIVRGIVNGIEDIFNFISNNVIIIAIILVVVAAAILIFQPELFPAMLSMLETGFDSGIMLASNMAFEFQWLWTGLQGTWVATAASSAWTGLEYLQKINQAALMVKAFENGNYEKGVSRLFNQVMPSLANRFDSKIQAVVSNVEKVYHTINSDISAVTDTIDQIDTGLSQVQTDLGNIGSAFGISELSKLGDVIGQFRKDTLERFVSQADVFSTHLSALFYTALNPFIQWDNQYQLIISGNAEAQNRLRGLVGWGMKENISQPIWKIPGHQFTGDMATEVRKRWRQVISTTPQALQTYPLGNQPRIKSRKL